MSKRQRSADQTINTTIQSNNNDPDLLQADSDLENDNPEQPDAAQDEHVDLELINQIMPATVNKKVDPFAGSIKKVVLKNFMTYSDVIFEPKQGLNVIIGPNGTGKSSLSAAMCLGLNGNISLTGRAKDAAEYIKYGTNVCVIEITLKQEKGGTRGPYVIKREIRRKDLRSRSQSFWFLNNVKVGQAQITHLCRKLGINLDNLCQYLPQERVKEFAQQKPYELLRNTQLALDTNLTKQHDDLIRFGHHKDAMEAELKGEGIFGIYFE